MINSTISLLLLFALTSINVNASEILSSSKSYLGFRHNHDGTSHKAMEKVKSSLKAVINKGRVNVYEVTNKNFDLNSEPLYVQNQFFKITESDLNYNPHNEGKSLTLKQKPEPRVSKALTLLSVEESGC